MNTTQTDRAGVAAAPARTSWWAGLAARPLLWLTLTAIALRLVIFLGRGDYVAFDEGWYLLLARNLFDGDGFTLTGLRHVTLSPLFPILAGAASVIVGDPIWAGRLVAAIAAGLLVWPSWHIFSRVADRKTAWIACIFVTVMPAMAPFAAPYWIGWDLWVGAEPLLHVFLYGGLAFAVRGWHRQRTSDWAFAGCALALAYLARSEAILPLCALGVVLTTRAAWLRTPRAALHVIAFGLAFALTAAPYWVFLHESTGRWTLTGRGVQVAAPSAPGSTGPSTTIESMLWDDDRLYVHTLYGLDATATRLSNAYWGIPLERTRQAVPHSADPLESARIPASTEAAEAPGARESGVARPTSESAASDPAVGPPTERPGRFTLYARALAIVLPWYLWPFIALGLFGARRNWREELLVAAPLVLTSIAIARVVAADPRTQLFLAPLAAFYAARGLRLLGTIIDRRMKRGSLRPGFTGYAATAILVLVFLGTEARWVYFGLRLGSPHHLVGTANRRVGEALRDIVPGEESVMSWHPAIALYARRDWRVLPYAAFDKIVAYANATGTEYIVLSQYYPPQGILGELPREHFVILVPPGSASSARPWQLEFSEESATYVLARLRPAVAAGKSASERGSAIGGS